MNGPLHLVYQSLELDLVQDFEACAWRNLMSQQLSLPCAEKKDIKMYTPALAARCVDQASPPSPASILSERGSGLPEASFATQGC